MERFSGRRILVTGAASGMGRAVSLRLLREGGRVLGCDVAADGLAETEKLASAQGTAERLQTAVLDIRDEARVGEVVGGAAGALGGLDVLVNAAGILRAAHTEECSTELWEQLLRVNVTGTFFVIRAALPALLDGGGVIVNFASTSSFFGHPYMAAYAASKGAVASLTYSLALEYAKKGVRVVGVAPGGVATPMVTGLALPDDADPAFFPKLMAIGRSFGEPDDIAGVVAMLASDDGSYLNGIIIRADGGTHM